MVKLSIIIPTLNEEKLIGELLEQLTVEELRKKYSYEIIIADGGSSDKTIKISEKFADKVLIDKSENKNIASGRNLGGNNAQGELITFINADIQFKNFDKFIEFATGKFLNSNKIASTFKVKVWPKEEIFSDKFFLGLYNNYFCLLNKLGLGMGRGECQLVKKEYYLKINGFNENLSAGEDYDLFRRLRRLGKIYCSNLIIYESPRRYRKSGHFKVLIQWFLNAVSVTLFNKSYSKKWDRVN